MKYIEPVMKLSDPSKEWFEIWYVDGVNYFPSYLVVVLPNPVNQEDIIVVDAAKKAIIYQSRNYEEVRNWLTEDEFSQVIGRQFNYDQ